MSWIKSIQHSVVGVLAAVLPFAFNWANSRWGDITLSVIFLAVYHKADAYLTAKATPATPPAQPTQ